MNVNQTPFDRALRGVIGIAIVASPVMGLDTVPYNWLGLIPWATAVLGWCPIYSMLGLSTIGEGSYHHGNPKPEARSTHPGKEAHA